MEKRGLSNLVEIVLILLLILVSIGVVWKFILPNFYSFEETAKAYDPKFVSYGFELSNIRVDEKTNDTSFLLRRTAGGETAGFYIVLEDEAGRTVVIKQYENKVMNEFDSVEVVVRYGDYKDELSKINKIYIYAIVFDGDEKILLEIPSLVSGGSGAMPSGSSSGGTQVMQCADGLDNDGDGYIDEIDLDCSIGGAENSDTTYDPSRSESGSANCNPRPDTTNLFYNGHLECGNENPDNWKKFGNDVSHILSWGSDPTGKRNSKILMTEFTGAGVPSYFNWKQEIDNVEPNEWYEFSVLLATDGIEPIIDSANNEMKSGTLTLGVVVSFYNQDDEEIKGTYSVLKPQGPELDVWDDFAWTFRKYKTKGFENWHLLQTEFKVPPYTEYIIIRIYNYPKGKSYFDNFVLRKLERDPVIDLKKSGTLDFVQYHNADFFPIWAYGLPKRNSAEIELSEFKEAGFNTISGVIGSEYKKMSPYDLKLLWLNEDLALTVNLPAYWTPNEYDNNVWMNDPEHLINYQGASSTRKRIDEYGNFENLLFFSSALDEIQTHAVSFGSWLPNLGMAEAIKNYRDVNAPDALLYYNYARIDSAYTGSHEDMLDYYLPLTDAMTFTTNTPSAYPNKDYDLLMSQVGRRVRRFVNSIEERGNNNYVIAFALGVYEWAKWDGVDEWHYNQKIPFNLQRFQIYEQIINGAVGVNFWGLSEINLDNPYDSYHWEQIKMLSKELSGLYDVLIEPEFFNEWEVSDSRVDIMMKKHNGKIYLFTASNYYDDLEDVKITLTNVGSIGSVKALNENNDRTFNLNNNRVVSYTNNVITDDFIGYSQVPSKSAPGYAVHIYEIEYF